MKQLTFHLPEAERDELNEKIKNSGYKRNDFIRTAVKELIK